MFNYLGSAKFDLLHVKCLKAKIFTKMHTLLIKSYNKQ